MVSVSYKRKKKRTIVDNAKALDQSEAAKAERSLPGAPHLDYKSAALRKLAGEHEFHAVDHVIDTTTKHYIPTSASDLRDAAGRALIDKIAERIKVPPALATQHEDQSEIKLTAMAHQYNLDAYGRMMHKADGYKALTVDHASMALELALFVLAARNGPDEAKRMHLLELAGGTWNWASSGRAESKDKDGVDKEVDLYLNWLGTTFLVGARASLIWKAGMEFRLGLHRKEFEEAKATKV